MTNDSDYLADLESWRAKRLAALKAPDGWLNLISRDWLSSGVFSVGSDGANDIVLPVGPARLGVLTQHANGEVDFVPADGTPPAHLSPSKKLPPKVLVDGLLLELTTINGENALRVRDTRSAAPAAFPGIESFPVEPDLRIVADWVAFDAPRGLTVDTSKQIATDVEATHQAVFTLAGQRFSLTATHGTPEAPQFVFRDRTASDATYPAGRFVYGENVTATSIVIDFNKAINPPCAFTDFAVCPLPPPENVLPIRIEAGEKRLPEGWGH
ncbi:DUF1684 domain-containing protein [Mesorhizobium sp. BR1-1-16]|uniref:DUF1684 domain-containing protein n=1 Tax=Mesorhizobium sp. BR1-1-16 TaxID=2876653 RepID=UPI001CCA1BD0|nr:DUF1684 domain-containing protein [Mesorhizobium sp. BR1-1-16]MBZ9934896.1 DUF1684 domain-containing protein [Mesorhizobium sp. BR1-1-16]